MGDATFVIIGANGQLGKALQAQYPNAIAVDSETLDITDREAVQNFDWSNITTIFNAAAYTNVDGAETHEGRVAAWKVNATGPANLAKIASQHNITLVHVSSEYVFDGSQEIHSEDEPFSPLSVYGNSKAAGDIAASLTPQHYILRVTWLIGEGKNFVQTMLNLGHKGISPTVVADQFGRLTFTTELVKAIDHLLGKKAAFGTYNVSNSGESASWAEITRAIFKEAGFDTLSVTDTSTAAYFAEKKDIAPRPLQSTLDLTKLQSTGFISIDWREDLADYVKQHLEAAA